MKTFEIYVKTITTTVNGKKKTFNTASAKINGVYYQIKIPMDDINDLNKLEQGYYTVKCSDKNIGFQEGRRTYVKDGTEYLENSILWIREAEISKTEHDNSEMISHIFGGNSKLKEVASDDDLPF